MRIKKRDGSYSPVDEEKISARVMRCAYSLPGVDGKAISDKAIGGLYDGVSTRELDEVCILTAANSIGSDPSYGKLASRLLSLYINEEVESLDIGSFQGSISYGHSQGLISDKVHDLVSQYGEHLSHAIVSERTDLFEYFGLRTLYDRYLLKDPTSRSVFETPQYFLMRVACGLANTVEEVLDFYELISKLDYLPSTPTLFNSGTHRTQMSSCYLLDAPQDNLESIYNKYKDIALLSKFAGGIGVAWHRVRSRGSHIKGTNGKSNGIVPWLKTLDSSVSAVNQGGKRKGACCAYLESWHADIEEFLELRDNTGDEAKRTHNLNLSNWIPDLFMHRVTEDGVWSLFDPREVPTFTDLFGEAFETAYVEAERKGLYNRQVKARDLYLKMMRTLAETGNGWICFKDASNRKANQTANPKNVIHLSNLCTEILEVTNNENTAVCNLGSVNLAHHVENSAINFEKLARTVVTAVKYLDRVIDRNFYPIDSAKSSNLLWRPIGLGVMGLQDTFFKMQLPYDDVQARELSTKIQREVYYHAIDTSCRLAKELGAHENFDQTRAAQGQLQFDLWNIDPGEERWAELKTRIKQFGLRNSLSIAIAPTATIASIVGSYESIEPQVSNLFKRETLSGEFLQINKYLVKELKATKRLIKWASALESLELRCSKSREKSTSSTVQVFLMAFLYIS